MQSVVDEALRADHADPLDLGRPSPGSAILNAAVMWNVMTFARADCPTDSPDNYANSAANQIIEFADTCSYN